MLKDPDRRYRERYQWALNENGITNGTPWEDLTDQQRQNIRNEVHRYDREMDDLGKLIRGS
jgi:hypothetical protein